MNDDLGEFVGKGFAILRKRIKEVEGRKPVDGIDGQDGKDGKDGIHGNDGKDGQDGSDGRDGEAGPSGLNGKDGSNGTNGNDGETIQGETGEKGDQGETGEAGQVGPRGLKGIDGTDGKDATATDGTDGVGIADGKINAKGHLILTLTDGTKKDVGKVKGKDAQSYQGMIAGGPSTARPSGVATLDFADDSNITTLDITGLSEITETSVINVSMRIEATADNSINDLLIDPIRVTVSAYTVGVGFTIYGTMDHGPAQGLYRVNWALA